MRGREEWRGWLRTYGDPKGQRVLPERLHAEVRSDLYDERVVKLAVWLVAVAPGWACVEQTVGDSRTWLAWVPRDRVHVLGAQVL
ncbi:MAG: hypothetical protein NVV66_18210 [Cellulomonas sp.]|uniref:hypothetical protein n=1 Tax=Cellulomonas sp. TaxID=40001 RepID=UPI002589ED41|nr:hypothetical protein [Cellulomonas sp.]MCR6706531.1 hypothetical protein [Cellulomonas sp.]